MSRDKTFEQADGLDGCRVQRRAILLFGPREVLVDDEEVVSDSVGDGARDWISDRMLERELELELSDSVGDGTDDLMSDFMEELRLELVPELELESRSPSVGAGAMFFGSDMVLVMLLMLLVL